MLVMQFYDFFITVFRKGAQNEQKVHGKAKTNTAVETNIKKCL